jgi:coenzyme F420-0:L-glutamate ligase / coenzyme F420-1:gamma-L-glutamate ligase
VADQLEILAVAGIGDVTAGADLAALIAEAAPWLRDGDVLVVTSKIVSKAEGQLVEVPIDGPDREARREELLLAETARPVARRGHTRIVQTHHGFVMASAGIDASNVDRSRLVLLPKDPDASARALRSSLQERYGLDVAVIISDTMGRPWRNGLTDVALGAAGLAAIHDYRGERDAYGNELQITQVAVIDELAAAGDLVKGKRDQVPVAVVRGFQPLDSATADDPGAGASVLIRTAEHDLFSLGTAEAKAAGLRAAAVLTDAPGFCVDGETVDPATVRAAVAGLSTVLTVEPVEAPGLPAGTAHVVRLPAVDLVLDAVQLGADVHRLRCALAAEGLATVWLPDAGVVAVGRP